VQSYNSTGESSGDSGDNLISEEEKEMIVESRKCSTCKEWHKYCKAECCFLVFISVSPETLKDRLNYIQIRINLTPDERRYYKMRGVRCLHGFLRFDKDKCKPHGNRIIYMRKCDMLTEDNLCEYHPDRKPKLCKALTVDTDPRTCGFEITPNCLFGYKMLEGENDKTQESNEGK